MTRFVTSVYADDSKDETIDVVVEITHLRLGSRNTAYLGDGSGLFWIEESSNELDWEVFSMEGERITDTNIIRQITADDVKELVLSEGY